MSLRPPVPDDLDNIPSLFALAMAVVRGFNPEHLTSPKRVHGSSADTPLEATYQYELYRCLYELRPRAVISAEYATPIGYTPAGRIDFLVHQQEFEDEHRSWGIELLRGDRLQEHANRFDLTGAYHRIKCDGMTDFIIVDFRTDTPTKPHPEIPDLIHVVFTDNYQSFEIYDHNLMKSTGQGFRLVRSLR
ncbi:hypothetical protein B0H17DRAFT_957123 [Mycena rosella]|uniref:Uncharacterized protein n=1 Tax=Mycena rosella TaxID=1033263 RepID=A0AAD7CMU1_MYCRO|nr:hypothetical protein B0H17DRAFT_957123 [Mycena rosella]